MDVPLFPHIHPIYISHILLPDVPDRSESTLMHLSIGNNESIRVR